jgi:GPH family glycoside/pentoside/hexuronide:cation symporter
MASWIVVLLGLFAMQADQVGPAYLLAFLSGSGIATAFVIPWSMLPDIIEDDQSKTGQRREGSFYAFVSFFQKLGTGAALWAMGLALAMTGYINPTSNAALPIQPPATVLAIRFFAGPIPVVLLALSILFAWRYPITRESHQALVDQLAARDA